MANHSYILARKIPWTEEPSSLQVGGVAESDMNEHTRIHKQLYYSYFKFHFITLPQLTKNITISKEKEGT